MRVRPANPDAVIRDPSTRRRVPDEGMRVPDTNYWRRRIRSGDVVVVDEPHEGEQQPRPEYDQVAPLATRPAPTLATRSTGDDQ